MSLAISPIISLHTPTWLIWICPRHDDSTLSICSMKCVVDLTDPSWGNLTNDCYGAEVVHNIQYGDARS